MRGIAARMSARTAGNEEQPPPSDDVTGVGSGSGSGVGVGVGTGAGVGLGAVLAFTMCVLKVRAVSAARSAAAIIVPGNVVTVPPDSVKIRAVVSGFVIAEGLNDDTPNTLLSARYTLSSVFVPTRLAGTVRGKA